MFSIYHIHELKLVLLARVRKKGLVCHLLSIYDLYMDLLGEIHQKCFAMLATVQKELSLNRKLDVAFIDFEKAFDSISRKLLWPILQKQGIRGKLLRCAKSMHDVKARVRDGVSLTESIHCIRGVKQGDLCSPILFSLFINELALNIIDDGKHGAVLTSTLIDILLFADGILLS